MGCTLAIIPARRDSRGLEKKHLRLLGGQPVITHTINAATAAKRVDRVLVSTNDPLVARVARRAGAEVPFLRPEHLAADDTPTHLVILHAVEWVEAQDEAVAIVVLLQPTSPLRGTTEIDDAVALLDDPTIHSAVSVAPTPFPSNVLGTLANGRFFRFSTRSGGRQVVPPAMRVTGGVYVWRRATLNDGDLLGGGPAALVVDPEEAIDLDTAEDLKEARRIIRRRGGR